MWRKATRKDDSFIAQMCQMLNAESPGPHPVPLKHTQDTLAILRSEPARGCAIVLDLDGKIAGYAFLISFWSNELGGEICNIDEFFVLPQDRGQGHGRQLIELIADHAHPADQNDFWPRRPVALELEVSPENKRARSLYLDLGFQPIKNSAMRRKLKDSPGII